MNNNENLLKIERQNQIRKMVEESGRVAVPELGDLFAVSEATIRRDLEELDGEGWVRRTHGGAVKTERALKEPPIMQRIVLQEAEKKRIGKAAASLIKDGETIFLGSGTTVHEVARNIPKNLQLTVITNSLPVANELAVSSNIELIVIGGMLRQTELSLVGYIAAQTIQEFRADRAFMGMRAIDVHHGFTNDYLPETTTDRAILTIAPQIIIVADHTKFGRVSSVLVGSVKIANEIITDTETDEEYVNEIREMGIKVRLV